MEKLFILDSTVFLEGGTAFIQDKPCATVYDVAEEMKSGKAQIEFDKLVRLGLAIIEPENRHVKEVEEKSRTTNDKLSRADKKVVALALHFREKGRKVAVVTDDYAVENLCSHFGLEAIPLSKKGIRKQFTWLKKCSACKKIIETPEDTCPVCGSPVKFVPKQQNRNH